MYIPELYYAISAFYNFFFPYTLYIDDDKALVSPSFEDTAADRGLELDTSTQSCEPKVNVSNKAYHTVHISVVVLGSINRLTQKKHFKIKGTSACGRRDSQGCRVIEG